MRWVSDPGLARAGAGETSSGPSPCATACALGLVEAGEQPLGAVGAGLGGAPRPRSRPRGVSSSVCSIAVENSRGARLGPARPAQPPAEERPVRGRSSRAVARRLAVAVELGEAALEVGDPLRERLDRLGDRVGQMDPVGVRPLDPLAVDLDRVAGVADHGGARRHVLDDDRVGADLGAVADRDRAQQLGARSRP